MPAPRTEAPTTSPFPQPARYAESLTWHSQPFTLPVDPRFRIKSDRVIVGTSRCNDGCKVYVTTDLDVEVLSQREIGTGIRVKDQPVVPGQTRKTSTRYLSLQHPTVWIGDDLAVELVDMMGDGVSFLLRSPNSGPPEGVYSNRSFNDYPV